MKILVNKCYGGYSLSRAAISALAKRKGKTAYFFKEYYEFGVDSKFIPLEDDDKSGLFFIVFDVPNPNDFDKEVLFKEHYLEPRPEPRDDADLIAVVEELGVKAASGSLAKLEIVEIPDDVNWVIDDYDGIETVEEEHRSW